MSAHSPAILQSAYVFSSLRYCPDEHFDVLLTDGPAVGAPELSCQVVGQLLRVMRADGKNFAYSADQARQALPATGLRRLLVLTDDPGNKHEACRAAGWEQVFVIGTNVEREIIAAARSDQNDAKALEGLVTPARTAQSLGFYIQRRRDDLNHEASLLCETANTPAT